ncbi:hypothetical protein F4604DRAFT_1677711 [Suillus subluteus]|nr:hypothetical protein F4604DRAFT_1677711 [Suillus subluteus]
MVLVSDDPSWWPTINVNLIFGYFAVVGCVGIIYDWVFPALTFGQEVELIWVRYIGIGYVGVNMLVTLPTISMTDAGCIIIIDTLDWTREVVDAILGAIPKGADMSRCNLCGHQNHQHNDPRNGDDADFRGGSGSSENTEELVLSGTYQCQFNYAGDFLLLDSMIWILAYRMGASGIIGDCFTVLMKTHMSYFVSYLSPTLSADADLLESQIYSGFTQFFVFRIVQMFVLGPRLILSIREYHAELVANSDTATTMASIAFQERIYVETSSSV